MDVYSSLSYRCLFFFFFQAEDGIRFLTVTGVQTCALPILTPNIASPLMVLFAVILLPAIIVRFYQGWFQMLYLDLPLFLASTCSVSTFYLVAQRELYPRGWRSRLKYMPLVMAVGIGLSLKNSKVVVEALLGT